MNDASRALGLMYHQCQPGFLKALVSGISKVNQY